MPSEEQGAAERFFEDLGYQCENTEARGTGKGRGARTHDLLGFVDFMAFRDALVHSGRSVDVRHAWRPIVYVQATDRSNASTRWNKIRGLHTAELLLRAGGYVALAAVGWASTDQSFEDRRLGRPSVDVRIVTYSDWKNTESWRDLDRWPEEG